MKDELLSFTPVLQLIQSARNRALQAVNKELIGLYWQIGAYISQRVAAEEWGKGVVAELARFIAKTEPSLKGFSDKNLWRMKQFYETYKDSEILSPLRLESEEVAKHATPGRELKDNEKLSPLVREISWTNHLIILSRCKSEEERKFYLRLIQKEKLSKRELERQINASLFERVALSKSKLSVPLKELPAAFTSPFKDRYVFEFLNLPEPHSEKDLQKAILQNLKTFLLEFSRDFAFIGEEFPLQVGNKDFELDLLFFNRALNCLVAIELKVVDFVPEYLGKLNFYLEALDRDIKKPHENPSIGILLCKAKDDEVVEYTMSRQLSAAMVAEYHLQLPDKGLLQAKLHEFFEINQQTES